MPPGARGLALALLAVCAGCAAPGTDIEALPFYREDRTEAAATRAEVPALLLAYDAAEPAPVTSGAAPQDGFEPAPDRPELRDRDHRGVGWILRFPWPFGTLVADGHHHSFSLTGALMQEGLGQTGPLGRALATDGAVRNQPFINFADDPEGGGFNGLPFVAYDTWIDHTDLPDQPGREGDADRGLLPLIAWGDGDRPSERYLAIAPFGGTTRGLIGKDEITWVGFPYPLYARVEDRSYTSHHVLWPVVNWVDGPRDSGFRVWPLFGHYEGTTLRGEPRMERTFVLWPLVTWQTDGLDEPEPTNVLSLLPLYGQIRGPDRDVTTLLWPLFKWDVDKARGRWELRAPFPVVSVAGGDDGRWKFDVWPLFGAKARPGFSRWFALWPLLRHEALERGSTTYDGTWVLPLFWRTAWRDARRQTDDVVTRVFPLFHYRRARDGSVDVAALSPFWRDDDGFERTLGALVRLYHYRRDRFGGVEHQALLGLASWRDLPARPGRAAYSRLSLLFGLVQARSHGGQGGLRLLWLLPELTWGEVGPAPPWEQAPLVYGRDVADRGDDGDGGP